MDYCSGDSLRGPPKRNKKRMWNGIRSILRAVTESRLPGVREIKGLNVITNPHKPLQLDRYWYERPQRHRWGTTFYAVFF